MSLFVALKAARAVSQSQRVVSARYFNHRADLLPAAPWNFYCDALASQYFMIGDKIMKFTTRISLISSTILLSILLLTDPQMLPSVILIAPFVLIFVALLACIIAVLGLYGDMPWRRKLRVGLAGAFIPVILLILQSLGQLTIRDVLAVFILFGVVYFYLSKLHMRATG